MSLEGKAEALLTWAREWLPLDGFLKLNAITTEAGECSISIEQNDKPIDTFVNGMQRMGMVFVFSAMRDYSSGNDDTNLEAQRFADSWQDWVSAQFKAGNLPDWGDTIIESIDPVQTIPTVAMVYNEDKLAKYQFQAQITYLDWS